MIVRFIIQKKTIIFLLLAPSFAQVHFLAGIVDEEGEDIGKNIIKKRTLILKNNRFFLQNENHKIQAHFKRHYLNRTKMLLKKTSKQIF